VKKSNKISMERNRKIEYNYFFILILTEPDFVSNDKQFTKYI